MALTQVETKVTWGGGSSTASVTAASSQISDVITLDSTCIAARIVMKADNASTPNAADVINFGLLETMGDPDGSGADEYVSQEFPHDLNSIDTSIRDPGLAPAQVPRPQKSFQVLAEGFTYSTVNAITVSATITELRSS